MKKYKWGSNKPYIYIYRYNIYIQYFNIHPSSEIALKPVLQRSWLAPYPQLVSNTSMTSMIMILWIWLIWPILDAKFWLIPKIEQDLWFTGFNKSWPVPIIYSYKYIIYHIQYIYIFPCFCHTWTSMNPSWVELVWTWDTAKFGGFSYPFPMKMSVTMSFSIVFPMFEQPPIRFIPICHPDTMRRWPPARHASDCPAPGNVWASLFTISLLGYPLFLIGLMILHNTECTEMTKKIDDFISHNSPQRTVGGMLHASNKLSKLLNIAYPVQWSWNRKRNAMDGVLRWAPIYFHTTKGPVLWRNLPSPQIIQAMDDHFRSDLKHEMDPNMVVSSLTHHGFLACV